MVDAQKLLAQASLETCPAWDGTARLEQWMYELGELLAFSDLASSPVDVPLAARPTSAPAISLSALLPLASVHWVVARRIALAGHAGVPCLPALFPGTRPGWMQKLKAVLHRWLQGLRGGGR